MAVMRCNTQILSFSFLFVYLHRYRPESTLTHSFDSPTFSASNLNGVWPVFKKTKVF